jgi:hypothetical protein
MAKTAVGGVEALMIRAAGKPALHIVDHAGVIDKGAIVPSLLKSDKLAQRVTCWSA